MAIITIINIKEEGIMAEGIEGNRVNSQLFIYDGYIYRKNSSLINGNKYYFTCARKSCSARAIKTDDTFKVTKEHNHLANAGDKEELAFKASCKQKARESTLDLRTIFDEECARFPNGSRRVTFTSFHSTMQKARHANRLPIHKTLREFGELITFSKSHTLTMDENPEDQQLFFRGMLQEGCITVLVFASDTMTLDALRNARHVHMDSFSKFLPDVLKHVFTVHVETFDYVFPCIYALMSHNSKEAYALLFKFINENLCPELCPECIVTDFEPELRMAISHYYPHAKHLESWYHYAQAVWQYTIQHKLTPLIEKHPPTRKIVRYLLSLPLLPPDRLQDGFNFVKRFADEENAMQRSTSKFFTYFNRQWMELVGCERLSVYGQNKKTNNFLNAFHSMFIRRTKHHQQNFWKFLEGLQCIDLFERQSYNNVNASLADEKFFIKLKPKYLNENPAVEEATEKLLSGIFTVGEFLMSTCNVLVEGLSAEIQAILREDADTGINVKEEQMDIHETEATFKLDHDYLAKSVIVMHEQPNLSFDNQVKFCNDIALILKEEQLPTAQHESALVSLTDAQIQDVDHGDHLKPIVISYCEEVQQQDIISINMQCVCCLSKIKSVLFLPCTHMCCCQICAEKIHQDRNNRRCPLCKVPYTRKIVALL